MVTRRPGCLRQRLLSRGLVQVHLSAEMQIKNDYPRFRESGTFGVRRLAQQGGRFPRYTADAAMATPLRGEETPALDLAGLQAGIRSERRRCLIGRRRMDVASTGVTGVGDVPRQAHHHGDQMRPYIAAPRRAHSIPLFVGFDFDGAQQVTRFGELTTGAFGIDASGDLRQVSSLRAVSLSVPCGSTA